MSQRRNTRIATQKLHPTSEQFAFSEGRTFDWFVLDEVCRSSLPVQKIRNDNGFRTTLRLFYKTFTDRVKSYLTRGGSIVSLSVSQTIHQLQFFQTVLDSLVDGIAIFSDRGELIHANRGACSLGEKFSLNSTQSCTLPEAILRVCQALQESRQLFPDRPLALDSEVVVRDSTVRLRGSWFRWMDSESPYLLVVLEDRCQSLQQQAIVDAQKYGLTPREAEVWSLRCARYSYKDIAAKLYISENTVKKHLKSVNAKRQSAS